MRSRNRAVVDGEETSQYPRSRRSPVDFLSSVNWAELGLKVLAALAILVVTAILATVLKSAVAKVSVKIPVLQRPGVDGAALGNSLGTIVSMAIWLLGLIVILGIFQLSQVLSPVTLMLEQDRKSTRLNSSHVAISYAVFCLKQKTHVASRGA